MNQDQYNVENAIEEAIGSLDAYARRDFLRDVISFADKHLDEAKQEIADSEAGDEDDDDQRP